MRRRTTKRKRARKRASSHKPQGKRHSAVEAEARPSATPTFDVLKPQYQQFVLHYLAHGNASRAYREAGYEADATNRCGSRLLTNVDIQKAISEMAPVVGVTADEVRAVLSEMLRADLADLEPVVLGVPLTKARAEGVPTNLIKRLKVTRTEGGEKSEPREEVQIEMHDRLKAAELYAKLLGMVVDRRQVQVSGLALPFDDIQDAKGTGGAEAVATAHAQAAGRRG